MRCDVCDNGERVSATRSRVAEHDGCTAVVLGVPVEECPACGQVWMTMDVAKRLDALFDQLLARVTELAQAHWDTPRAA